MSLTPPRRLPGWLALGLLAAAALAACGGDDRPTLTVFAAASLTDVFRQAAPAFEAQEDVRLRFAFGGSQRLRFQLQQGARADLFASADREQMALVEADGLIAAAPIVFAANDLVLIVPAENPAGLTAPADLLTTDLRLVVAAPDVPAGRLTRAFLHERGWTEAVLPTVVSQEDNVRAVVTKVAVAEADAGFVYASDAGSAPADLRAFALPTALRNDYLIAPLAGRADDPLVQRFLDFVAGEHVQALLRAAGFRPPPEPSP